MFREPPSAEILPSEDCREKGYVTPVKDQGQCGSCRAFSAAGALEGQMFQKTGKLVSGSQKNLVDCFQAQGSEGCNGGLMDNAFQCAEENKGLDSEESYIYHARDESCKNKPEFSAANGTGFVDIISRR